MTCESVPTRRRGVVLAVALSGLFFWTAWAFWVPAHAGVDQNAYLVGGRWLAETGSMAFRPTRPDGSDDLDPHAFVGRMWVVVDGGTPRERYYPKYPPGYPTLVALAWRLGLPFGVPAQLAYLVNPVLMTLAVFGTFVLGRSVGGSYAGVLAAGVFAASPTVAGCVTNPNSHAASVAATVWGVVSLIRWVRVRKTSAGVPLAAGLLTGFATTVRYTDALLALPLAFAAGVTLWRGVDRRSRRHVAAAGAGWMIPITLLLTHNLVALGSLTGYANTNEGDDFRLEYAASNWEPALRQLSTGGLFGVFPVGLLGLGALFAWRPRVAGVLALASIPTVWVYLTYYWAPDGAAGDVRYLRFFAGTLPIFAATAFAWIVPATRLVTTRGPTSLVWTSRRKRVVLLVGSISALAAGIYAWEQGRPKRAYPSGFSAVYIVEEARRGVWSGEPRRALPFVYVLLAAGAGASAVTAGVILGRRATPALLAGGLATVAIAAGTQQSLELHVIDQADRLAVRQTADAVSRAARAEGSGASVVVFSDERSILQHLQFVGGVKSGAWRLYAYDAFDAGAVARVVRSARPTWATDATADDPVRTRLTADRLGRLPQHVLTARARQVVSDATASGGRVLLLNTLPLDRYIAVRSAGDREVLPPPFDAYLPDRASTSLVGVWNVPDVMPRPERFVPHSRRRWADPWPGVIRHKAAGRLWRVSEGPVP